MQVTRQALKDLFTQWNFQFQQAYNQAPTFYDQFASTIPSASSQSVYAWLAQIGGMRKWEGSRQIKNAAARDYTLVNSPFELTIGLDRDKIQDDQFGLFGTAVEQLGYSAKVWPDEQLSAVVKAGNSSTCWDGQNFYDTDHPIDLDDASKGTYINNLVGAAYNLANDPIGAFKLGRAAMAKFVDEAGRPLNATPDTLMVGPDLEEPAMRIASAQLNAVTIKNVAGSENVAAAAVSNVLMGNIKQVIVNPWLGTDTAAYLMCTQRPVRPFVWQLRKAPELVSRVNPEDPSVFDLKTFLYGVDARGAAGYGLPWMSVRLAPS